MSDVPTFYTLTSLPLRKSVGSKPEAQVAMVAF